MDKIQAYLLQTASCCANVKEEEICFIQYTWN